MLHSSVCVSRLLNGESAIRVDACVPWQDEAHLIAQRAACVGVGGGEVVGRHGPCGPVTRRDLHRAGRRPLTTVHQGSELRRLVSSSHRDDGNQNENRRQHPELRLVRCAKLDRAPCGHALDHPMRFYRLLRAQHLHPATFIWAGFIQLRGFLLVLREWGADSSGYVHEALFIRLRCFF